MHTEDDSGDVKREEPVHKITDWVVVGGDEGVGNGYGVVPGVVPGGQGVVGG